MNNREQQKKFAEQSTINNSTFDVLNTNQTRYSSGQGKELLPTDREESRISNYYFLTGVIYVTGFLFGIGLFCLVVLLGEKIVSSAFYDSTAFLVYVLLFCVIMSYLWVFIGLKLAKKYRRK